MTHRLFPRHCITVAACACALMVGALPARAAQSLGAITDVSEAQLTTGNTGEAFFRWRDASGEWKSITATVSRFGRSQVRLVYSGALPPDRRCKETTPLPPAMGVGPTWSCRTTLLDGTRVIWVVQAFHKRVPDFGGDATYGPYDAYLSLLADPIATVSVSPTWANANAGFVRGVFTLPPLGEVTFDGLPQLLAYSRWSKFSPGGYAGYLKGRHYPVLFGSFSFSGDGVFGPGNRYGAPTDEYGRNVYIDTRDSDYGSGWHRIMGVLTQPPNGTWCYELGPKRASGGRTGISDYPTGAYRLTAIGPGLTPVVRTVLNGPAFPFGAPGYDPKTMPWGVGFSDGQAQAVRNQIAMIGPSYTTKAKGTDCAATLRQLPAEFLATAPTG